MSATEASAAAQDDSTQPAAAVEEPSPKKEDELRCDLCQKVVVQPTMEQHIAQAHPSLLRLSEELASYKPLVGDAAMKPEVLVSIGSSALAFAAKADGGEAQFKFVVNALAQLRAVCKLAYRDAYLFAFGSCLTLGTYDGEGDVDMTLVDPDGWENGDWPKDEASVIKKLARCLRDVGFKFEELEPVLHTRVPVLRRKHIEPPLEARRRIDEIDVKRVLAEYRGVTLSDAQKQQICEILGIEQSAMSLKASGTCVFSAQTREQAVQIYVALEKLPRSLRPRTVHWQSQMLRPEMFLVDFDLTCRAHGIRNSQLIRAYMDQSPLVRAGSLFLKTWSKRCGLNNSIKGFITSYAVQLLWIHFLIRHEHVKFVPTDAFPKKPDPSMTLRYTETVPCSILQDERSKLEFEMELGRVIRSFYVFYAFEFDWAQEVVTVSQSEPLPKERIGWTRQNEVFASKFKDRVWYRICIEDPFEENLNLGRHQSPNKQLHVLSVFRQAVRAIDQQKPDALLAGQTADDGRRQSTRLAAAHMIGRHEASKTELLEHLSASNLPAAAACQLESTVSSIFAELGLETREDGETLFYPKSKKKESRFVDEGARELLDETRTKLKSLGPVGLHCTPEVKSARLHLTLLDYDDEHDRLFDSASSEEHFQRHATTAQRLVDQKQPLRLDQFLQGMEKKLDRRFDQAVAQAVWDECAWFSKDGGKIVMADFAFRRAEPKSFVPERYQNREPRKREQAAQPQTQQETTNAQVKQMDTGGTGNCSGCRRKNVTIWPTSEPEVDSGWYCDACWAAY